MQEWPAWLKAIAQVGFPIVVALWLIFRADPAVQATHRAMLEHRSQAEQSLVIQRLTCQSTAIIAKNPAILAECSK